MNQWCEKVIALERHGDQEKLVYTDSLPNTENVVKVLQPQKFFSEEARKDLKPGDQFEICPSANNFTKDICSLIELTQGAALIIDYGEDHAFSNSFRVSLPPLVVRFFCRE